jgi:hypothetical protein
MNSRGVCCNCSSHNGGSDDNEMIVKMVQLVVLDRLV